jgi:hypothetical protein
VIIVTHRTRTRSVNLIQYQGVLEENGFDTLALLTAVQTEDLDQMGFKLGHKRQFLRSEAK